MDDDQVNSTAASPAQPAAEDSQALSAELAELISDSRRSLAARLTEPAQPAAAHLEQPPQPLLHIATGRSAFSNRIDEQRSLSWWQLEEELRTATVHIGKQTLQQYEQLKAGGEKGQKDRATRDKDTRWWSPWGFTQNMRNAKDATECSAIVLDADAGMLTAAQITERLGDVTHLIYSTYSHSPQRPKYRVVIPLSRSVTKEEFRRLHPYFVGLFPNGAMDSSSNTVGRLWYYPSAAADMVEHRECQVIEGIGFCDVDVTLTDFGRQPEATDSAEELPAVFAARDPIVIGSAHPNDALSLPKREREETSPEEVRAALRRIRLKDGLSQRGPWTDLLCAVKHWGLTRGNLPEAWEIFDAWSRTQRDHNPRENRRIWNSFERSEGITVAKLFWMVRESDPRVDVLPPDADDTEEAVETTPTEPPAEPTEDLPALARIASNVKARIDALIAGGIKKQAAALEALEEDLVFIVDQQAYFSKAGRSLLNQYAIRQIYRPAMPRKSDGGRMDPCKLLENSLTKTVVESMAFHPGLGDVFVEHGRLLANWYRPWHVTPEKPTPRELELFRYLLNHIGPRTTDKPFMEYMVAMLAYGVQHLGEKIASAPLLYSPEQGTGKTTMLYEVPRLLFGPPNSQLVLNSETDSAFSDFLAKAHFLHLDEVFMGGMKDASAAADKWKPVITNSTIRVHPKGFAGYDISNHVILTACSNRENALYLSDFDRRHAVHEIRSGKLDKGFASEFYSWLKGPRGAAVLKYIFLGISTVGFNPHADAPMTREKKAMIYRRDDLVAEIRAMLEEETYPLNRQLFKLKDLRDELGQRVPRFRNTGWTRLADALSGIAQQLPYARRTGPEGKQERLWTTGDPDLWSAATDEEIKDHFLTGAVPEPATPAPSAE